MPNRGFSPSHGRRAAVLAVGLASLSMAGPAVARAPGAQAARALNVRDEGRLHFIRASGSLLLDEGRATGTFPGWVKVRFVYNGEPTVTAQVTIFGSGGS